MIKHDQLLAALRSSYTWQPSATMTTGEWRQGPEKLSSIVDRMTDTKRRAQEERSAEAFEQGVRALRQSLGHGASMQHNQLWDKGQRVSHAVNEALWRHPDCSPSAPPDTNFRARFRAAPEQIPWKPNDEFPNAAQSQLPVQGTGPWPVGNPQPKTHKFYKFRCTESFQSLARTSVTGAVRSIGYEAESIPDEGTTISVRNYKDAVCKDYAEMGRVWDKVHANPEDSGLAVGSSVIGE